MHSRFFFISRRKVKELIFRAALKNRNEASFFGLTCYSHELRGADRSHESSVSNSNKDKPNDVE